MEIYMLAAVGIVEIFLSVALTFFVNHQLLLNGLTLLAILSTSLLMWQSLAPADVKYLLVIGALTIVFSIVWLIFRRIVLFDLFEICLILHYALLLNSIRINVKNVFLKNLDLILLALAIIVSVAMVIFLNDGKILGAYFQKHLMKSKNSMQIPAKTTQVIDQNYLLTDGIRYGEKYPNSYLAVLKSKKSNPSWPTILYVHGGGFIGGTALSGDPNAVVKDMSMIHEYERMIDHHYNVVTINYALAPQYMHPVPVEQMTEAVAYLRQHAQEMGINMDKIVIEGGSSGGHIAAEFVAIQVNPEYAARIGIEPILARKNIAAMVLDSAALDINRGSKTQAPSIAADYLFAQLLSSYTGQPAVGFNKKKVWPLNLINSINANFPPVFLSDGNYGTFYDQSQDYYQALKENGVVADIYIPDPKDGKAIHGYMVNDAKSKFTKIYNQKKYKFLLDNMTG